MIEPLRLSFTVACDAAHAFQMFTEKASLWWPYAHSVSAEPGITVTFEPWAGGRIYERTSVNTEFDWGEIVAWAPPQRLAYLWHIRLDRSQATEVEVAFTQLEDGTTRVDIEHGGWDRLNTDAQKRRDGNQRGWDGLLPSYRAACATNT